MTTSRRILPQGALWIGLGVAALLVAGSAVAFVLRAEREAQAIQVRAASSLETLARHVADSLQPARILVDSLAPALESESALADLENTLRSAITQAPQVYGCGAAFDPDWLRTHPEIHPNGLGQFSVTLVQGRLAAPQPRAILYDYTDTTLQSTRWYTQAARRHQASWSEPYFGQAAQASLVAYSRPLFDSRHRFMGVAFATMSLPRVKERITAQGDLGGGYVVLLSGKGTVLLHPRMDTVEGRSVRSVAAQAKDTVLRRFSDSLDQGSLQGDLIRPGPRPCTDTRLKYRRLPDLGWTLLA